MNIHENAHYFFNPYAIPALLIAFTTLFLSLQRLIMEKFSPVAITLAFVGTTITLWLTSNFLTYSATQESTAIWWAKVSNIGIAFIPAAIYHFAVVVLQIDKKHSTSILTGYILSTLFSTIAVKTDLIVGGVIHHPWGYMGKATPFNIVLILYLLTFCSLSLRHFWIGRKHTVTNSSQYHRVRTFFIAFSIGSLGLVDYIPAAGIRLFPFGFIAIFIALWIVTKTIEKYRLVDITPRFASQAIIDTMKDSLLVLDAERIIRLVNKAAARLLGYSGEQDITGKHVSRIFPALSTGGQSGDLPESAIERDIEISYIHPNGATHVLDLSSSLMKDENGQTLAHVYVMRDITAMKQADEALRKAHDELEQRVEERSAELRQANEQMAREIAERKKYEAELLKIQKLESLGVLAGGIAHDFNNILMAILGNVSLVKMRLRPDDNLYAQLEAAEKASLLARDLTQQLLTFSKGGAPVKKILSLDRVLKNSAGLALRGSNIRCEFHIDDDLWTIEADEGQMGQVFNNLIINACQAMPSGGLLRISADNNNIRTGSNGMFPLREGTYVRITFEDQGIGIPAGYLEKIFDPYFTTKKQGSGLGLAVTYSIINKHNGHISVDSTVGAGTTFTIHLPAHGRKAVEARVDETRGISRSGRILIMDDEEIVISVVCEMLKRSGYQVEAARDGREVIELYRKKKEAGQAFDAVIMDLTVPGGMGGKEAIQKLREIDPHVKAIVSSGYSNDPVMANYRDYGFRGVIAKPYSSISLNTILDKVVAGSTQAIDGCSSQDKINRGGQYE